MTYPITRTWSPDGTKILFCSTRSRDEFVHPPNEVEVVGLARPLSNEPGVTHLADLFVLPDRFGRGNRRATARHDPGRRHTPDDVCIFRSAALAALRSQRVDPVVAQPVPRSRLGVLAAAFAPHQL